MVKDITHENHTKEQGKLSNDLGTITAEIRGYQNMAGQAVFEIGRRLKWVKDNDLAHGEWLTWLDSVNIGETFARRSIQIYTELFNSSSVPKQDLNMSILYEIATLPPEERTKEHITNDGSAKVPEDMNRQELRDLKKQLKEEKDGRKQTEIELKKVREQASDRQFELSQQLISANNKLQNLTEQRLQEKQEYEDQLKKVQKATNTKIVERVKTPEDYDDLKNKIKANEIKINGDAKEKEELYKSIDVLKNRAARYAKTDEEYHRKTEEVDSLKSTIENLKSEKEIRQKASKVTNQLLELVNHADKLIDSLDLTQFDSYDPTLTSISKVTDKMDHVTNELRDKLALEYDITD
ncbi:hypothetical protein [Fructilactobacillus cliffordii]|uniref:DUF3102 domain-containing protein n=1 Tax=Fructilactobacillus cliffordii TaxID=2940299 RepID=A0A9Q8ZUI6_9LACO|nr:hypothetical protein [Fructilactobacillus cliffordii]USS89983.1 hypothetical protein M3M40_07285 [Fructilactobacillus cliffordii]